MNLPVSLADTGSPLTGGVLIIVVVAIVLVVFINLALWISRYTKVGPNQVLIVSGRKHRMADVGGAVVERGFRIVKGGGTFVLPIVERADILPLELLTISANTPKIYAAKGVPLTVDWAAQIKIKDDDASLATAAGQLLGKTTAEIKNIAIETLEGRIRAVLGAMTVEDINQNRGAIAPRIQDVAADDMAQMGLSIFSLTFRDIAI
jgi:flotillin